MPLVFFSVDPTCRCFAPRKQRRHYAQSRFSPAWISKCCDVLLVLLASHKLMVIVIVAHRKASLMDHFQPESLAEVAMEENKAQQACSSNLTRHRNETHCTVAFTSVLLRLCNAIKNRHSNLLSFPRHQINSASTSSRKLPPGSFLEEARAILRPRYW